MRGLVISNDLSTNRELLTEETLAVEGEFPRSPSQGCVELQRNHSRWAAAQKTADRLGQQGVEDPLSQGAHPCRGNGAQYFPQSAVRAAGQEFLHVALQISQQRFGQRAMRKFGDQPGIGQRRRKVAVLPQDSEADGVMFSDRHARIPSWVIGRINPLSAIRSSPY